MTETPSKRIGWALFGLLALASVGCAAGRYSQHPATMEKSAAGRVVNLSSDMASLGTIDDPQSVVYEVWAPAYQASKSAVNALTVLFAKQLKQTNIKVNSASPGWTRTAMGGDAAPLSVAEGADTAVWLATLPPDGPNGAFFSSSRSRGAIEW